MEIKATQGDCIAIPKGCAVDIQDGCVVFEPTREEFKDGDILCSEDGADIVIFKSYVGWPAFSAHYHLGNISDEGLWDIRFFQPASEEQKETLFLEMKAMRLRWNSEKKRVERLRGRSEEGDLYWYIGGLSSIYRSFEEGTGVDIARYESGNYFRSCGEAARFLDIIKDALRKFHQDDQL